MDTLLSKFSSIVNGIITGFDRIVFKGILKSIVYAKGMQNYLYSRNILNKDFKEYAITQSEKIRFSIDVKQKAYAWIIY